MKELISFVAFKKVNYLGMHVYICILGIYIYREKNVERESENIKSIYVALKKEDSIFMNGTLEYVRARANCLPTCKGMF